MMRYFGNTREYWEENLDLEFYNKAQTFLLKHPPVDILYAAVHKYKVPSDKEVPKSLPPLMGEPEYEP